jgi:methionyl-tRNA formyltransferase
VLRVAFAGTPEFALPALEALLERHRVVGVLTQPDRPRGRGRRIEPGPVKRAALARGLPLAQPATLASEEARAPLEAWRPEALVVVAYGLILPPEVLAISPLGCLNIHASLLPRWRGAAPIERAILAGDAETGVTIMQMDSGLDTGPMLLERPLAISPSHTAGTLRDELSRLGAAALLEALEGLTRGTLKPTPQPAEGVTYAAKIAKSEARIDWRRDALDIERRIRAFNPWPVAETALDGEPLRVLRGRAERPGEDLQLESNERQKPPKSFEPGTIVAVLDDFVLVQCGQGRLRVLEVQRPGRRRVSARDYAHGMSLVGRHFG